jgi:hypothetical protein
VLAKDDARRIAFNIARPPELLGTGSRQNQQDSLVACEGQ